MNTKRHLLRVTLLFVVMMLSSSMQVMAQKYDLHKLMVEAAKQNEDFKNGVKLASISNYKEAVIYFEKAARSGIPIAMFQTGYNYEQLNDFNKAVEWYTKGAQKGEAESQLCLAYCYEKGDGVKKTCRRLCFGTPRPLSRVKPWHRQILPHFIDMAMGWKRIFKRLFIGIVKPQ